MGFARRSLGAPGRSGGARGAPGRSTSALPLDLVLTSAKPQISLVEGLNKAYLRFSGLWQARLARREETGNSFWF